MHVSNKLELKLILRFFAASTLGTIGLQCSRKFFYFEIVLRISAHYLFFLVLNGKL